MASDANINTSATKVAESRVPETRLTALSERINPRPTATWRASMVSERQGMRWLRRTASLALAISLVSATSVDAAKPPYDPQKSRRQFHGIMVDAFYIDLAHCESGFTKDRKPVWDYQSRSYTGAFGIYRQTWRNWSPPQWKSAKGRTPRQQVQVADNIAWRGIIKSDGSKKWPVGPWGWGSIKRNCRGLQTYICKAKHPLVVRWRRNACR